MEAEREIEQEALADFDNQVADAAVERACKELEKLAMNCGE